ncbi:HVO_0476 family zinc finger protein [Halalkalicoccus sp. NIPERK01]|uniref:HVO_0476 family zinc finger protein n=1 Tax=Halalkalicoccus sp. NIPERK01 TaxID=3053469 RepID=UPI00256F0283|nr:HVO_0476 family zinc finger protein [Halalkalicoccus sp. NIPERK01]MDL5362011.1 HVO_0476 family zinc finger protein [Halalkalicoccus sp. NIPERK01]
MSNTASQVALVCPSCSPDEETVHEVLKPGGQATVRCTACGHTHKTRIEEETEADLDVIVSQDDESFSASAEVPEHEELAVGEEFVLDTEEAILLVRITSIELDEDRRVESAYGEEIRTLWTRAVDNVSVNLTVHPNENREESRSVKLGVPGDHEFTVGEREEMAGEEFVVTGIHVKRDATGYDRDKFDFDGDSVPAKDVKRLYGEDDSPTAWSAW